MNHPTLIEDLPHLIGDVALALKSTPTVTTQPAAVADDHSPKSLAEVMHSSRVRAWVPPHLLESLRRR
jgi:hypothetical protein